MTDPIRPTPDEQRERAEADMHTVTWTPPPPGSPREHVYLSTGCFHGDHDYCKSMTGLNGAKRPAECKKCGAKCICDCHRTEGTDTAPADIEPPCCSDPTCACDAVNAEGRCECSRWEDGADTVTPSRRVGLHVGIVNALGQTGCCLPVAHRRAQANAVLALLYREWPWLRAEAEGATPSEPSPAVGLTNLKTGIGIGTGGNCWAGSVVPTFTARPVTPEMERAATERAVQAAADSEKTAAWFKATGGVIGATALTRASDSRGDAIAYRIRAELVCCHIYDRVNDTHELTIQQAMESRDWHDLCYWGEASARIAEGRCPGYETEPNICRCECEGCKHGCGAHHEPEPKQPARTTPGNSPTSSDTTDNPAAATEATEPVTITDPAWLRQQYAAALRDHGLMHPDERVFSGSHDCCVDAVLAVRDRHLEQLRQRLTLADTELQQWTAAESADAAAGSYALRAEKAEQQRDQLADDLRYTLADHGPRHSHKQPGTWDDTGQPCDHCARLEQARQHLANLTPTEA